MEEIKEIEIVSRKGYDLKELARIFIQTLGETGQIASGKLLHYTADFICSGGLQLWQKICWEYAYDHIGVASPRIFLYLTRKYAELTHLSLNHSTDTFSRLPEVQEKTSEIALIIQMCPKKSKTKYPTVPMETHENEDWLRSALRTTDRRAVRLVWQYNVDMEQMLHAGNEMVYDITEGATERALFWAKWLIEEDAFVRKTHGTGLTTIERGPASLKSSQRTMVGYYIVSILAEVYKEYVEKGMIRMHEEFQTLINIYRSNDAKNTHKQRMDTIAIMIHLLTDVPKWKVPASPSLVADATVLQRMVSQSNVFYDEILANQIPAVPLPDKLSGLKQKKPKNKSKEDALHQKLEMIDKISMGFYKM